MSISLQLIFCDHCRTSECRSHAFRMFLVIFGGSFISSYFSTLGKLAEKCINATTIHISPYFQGNLVSQLKLNAKTSLNPFLQISNPGPFPSSKSSQPSKPIQIVRFSQHPFKLPFPTIHKPLIYVQSIIYRIVYNNITQFQQMPSFGKGQLALFLKQIKHILKEYSLRNASDGVNLLDQISKATEQLQAQGLSSQKIVKLMIADGESQAVIKGYLMRHLRKNREEGDIMQEYEQYRKQGKEAYRLSASSLNTLIKEILENCKLIEEELLNLNHNIQSLKKEIIQPQNSEPFQHLSLYLLLKIVMGDTNISFSQNMNEFLFRMYILEESISLIFVKTQKVFEEITEKLNGEDASRRSSYNSEKTGKRSALSESIEIFKRNQLKKELQRNDLLNEEERKESQIQSDYKMTRKTEKRVAKGDNRMACCFRF